MGESRKLWIPGPAGKLEAELRGVDNPNALAVVAHPHPQHGGTMHNSVIFHSSRELNRAGWTTLRFNFRGVEGSEGEHDGTREDDDLDAAAAWLRGLAPGRPLHLVGFSFGATCALRVGADDDTVAGIVAIGIATQYYGYEETARLDKPFAVVQGEHDELADMDKVRDLVARANGELYVIPQTGHLFRNKARDAANKVVEAARAMLSRAG
jgi:alpha/beta superfamily hydrolase